MRISDRRLMCVLAMLATPVLVLTGACADGQSAGTSLEIDVAGRLMEVALSAHEASVGMTRPARIHVELLGQPELPAEVEEGIRDRLAVDPRYDGDSQSEATWVLSFQTTPAEPGIVYVGVRSPGAVGWPTYGIPVTQTSSGWEVGNVLAVGKAITR